MKLGSSTDLCRHSTEQSSELFSFLSPKFVTSDRPRAEERGPEPPTSCPLGAGVQARARAPLSTIITALHTHNPSFRTKDPAMPVRAKFTFQLVHVD